LTFLARMLDTGIVSPRGIASEEYTAVCINEQGEARVYGDYPEFEDYAHFVRLACETDFMPEIMDGGTPLTWQANGEAVAVCKVPGTSEGDYTFNLNDWLSNQGGTWERWTAIEGELFVDENAQAPDCTLQVDEMKEEFSFNLFPNPTKKVLHLPTASTSEYYRIMDDHGKQVDAGLVEFIAQIDVSELSTGIYTLLIDSSALRFIKE